MALTADVEYNEPHASHSLNRKFTGVIPRGIYTGFEVAPEGGNLNVVVSKGLDLASVAIVERDGYCLTVRETVDQVLAVPNNAGVYHIVLEAHYAIGSPTAKSLKVVTAAALQAHHIILASITMAGGEAQITAGMISEKDRMMARDEPRIYVKPADETVVNSMTPQDDDYFKNIPLRKGKKYRLGISFRHKEAMYLLWAVPVGVTVYGSTISVQSDINNSQKGSVYNNAAAEMGGTAEQVMHGRFVIDCTNAGGLMTLRWAARNTSTTTILRQYSFLTLEVIR